jgi:hypothetical protein
MAIPTRRSSRLNASASASSSATSTATATASASSSATPTQSPRRSPRLSTPSYIEASLRSYKVYTPIRGRTRHSEEPVFGSEYEAAEALVSMGEVGEAVETEMSFQRQSCLNPMNPVTRYIYKLGVYSIDQTTHYNTAYVVYNRDTRTYYVYSVISTTIDSGDAGAVGATAAVAVGSLPEPINPIQTKFTTYVNITTYIMNLVIPSKQREYCVLSDFIGVVGSDADFKDRVFSTDSCYYDIDEIWNANDSTETITGHKMFILTPTRVYYWDAGAGVVPTSSMYTDNDIYAAMEIISTIQ